MFTPFATTLIVCLQLLKGKLTTMAEEKLEQDIVFLGGEEDNGLVRKGGLAFGRTDTHQHSCGGENLLHCYPLMHVGLVPLREESPPAHPGPGPPPAARSASSTPRGCRA